MQIYVLLFDFTLKAHNHLQKTLTKDEWGVVSPLVFIGVQEEMRVKSKPKPETCLTPLKTGNLSDSQVILQVLITQQAILPPVLASKPITILS